MCPCNSTLKVVATVSQDMKPDVPSAGTILAALTNAQIDGEKYDRELPATQRDTLY
jgi:hypothetical protein